MGTVKNKIQDGSETMTSTVESESGTLLWGTVTDGEFLKITGKTITSAALLAAVGTLLYPVGCIYTTINPANPSTIFGFGTWVAFGTGRIPIGVDGLDSDFNTVEETGGAKTHTHTAGTYAASAPTFTGTSGVVPAQTISWPGGVPTAANESTHTHDVTAAGTNATSLVTPTGTIAWPGGVPTNTAPTFTGTAWSAPAVSWPGGVPTFSGTNFTMGGFTAGLVNAVITTKPSGTIAWPAGVPTIAGYTPAGTVSAPVISWPGGVPTFTGGSNTVGAQTFTGSSVTSTAGSAHTHTISWPGAVPTNATVNFTPVGTNSAPVISGSSAASSNMPPYIAVYMWKRTA